MSFEHNYDYYFYAYNKKDVNPYSWSKLINGLVNELRNRMMICRKKLHYTQELQKQYHNKAPKPRSYILKNKF